MATFESRYCAACGGDGTVRTPQPCQPCKGTGLRAEPPKAPNTVKVRIPVAVGEDGEWYAENWHNAGDGTGERRVLADLSRYDGRGHVVYVEAEVPLPSVQTVAGSVVEPTREGQ
jgi:DnaJ-class molecular chaperone